MKMQSGVGHTRRLRTLPSKTEGCFWHDNARAARLPLALRRARRPHPRDVELHLGDPNGHLPLHSHLSFWRVSLVVEPAWLQLRDIVDASMATRSATQAAHATDAAHASAAPQERVTMPTRQLKAQPLREQRHRAALAPSPCSRQDLPDRDQSRSGLGSSLVARVCETGGRRAREAEADVGDRWQLSAPLADQPGQGRAARPFLFCASGREP